jgi:hypothetical protein
LEVLIQFFSKKQKINVKYFFLDDSNVNNEGDESELKKKYSELE